MSYARFLCFVILSAVGGMASALAFETNGDLDLSFNPARITNGEVVSMVLQGDGNLVIAGGFSKVNGVVRHSIARLKPDGSLDLTFDTGTGPDGDVSQVILQNDGKFIIVGGFANVNGTARNGIARLNSNGSLDASFDPGALLSEDGVVSGGVATTQGFPTHAALQSDQKVIVIGEFGFVANGATTSAARSGVARFTSAGVLDGSYNPGSGLTLTGSTSLPSLIVLQSSGKAIIQGQFDKFNGTAVPGFVRLDTSGGYDSSFNVGTATTSTNVRGLFVQADDRVIVWGDFFSFNGSSCHGIVRLLIDGPVDGGFATGVFQNYNYNGNIESVGQQPDGKLLVGGVFYSIDGTTASAIARLNTNGSRDGTFSGVGTKTAGEVISILVRPSDSHVFLGGYFSTYQADLRNNIVLTNPDGTTDTAFAPTSGVTDWDPEILAIMPQTDGKIIIGGIFSSIAGVPKYNIARLNSDGSLDNTFTIVNGLSRSVRGMTKQSTGKIIVVGNFFGVDGVPAGHILRLNTDGTIDNTFNAGIGSDDLVYAAAIDSSDNIYIGGLFGVVEGSIRINVAKLGPDGALDTSFDPLSGTGGVTPDVFTIAPLTATSGVVLGGRFSTYRGTTVSRIVRLNATTAAMDIAFTGTVPPFGFGGIVRGLSLTPSGQYYATGSFINYRGTSSLRLARLNSSGTLDTTFSPSPGLGPNGASGRGLLQQNGKIVVGGTFTTPHNLIERYTTSGAEDTSFNPGTGFVAPDFAHAIAAVDTFALTPSGKMYVGGLFSTYNGIARTGVVRLTRNTLSITSVQSLPGALFRLIGKGEPLTTYNILSSPDLVPADFVIIDTVTTDGSGNFQYDAPALGTAHFYEVGWQ